MAVQLCVRGVVTGNSRATLVSVHARGSQPSTVLSKLLQSNLQIMSQKLCPCLASSPWLLVFALNRSNARCDLFESGACETERERANFQAN